MIYPDGSVTWMPPSLFRATCNLKIMLFPFDKQDCTLIFRSSDFDASVLDFDMIFAINNSNIEGSNVSAEWVLLSRTQEQKIAVDDSKRTVSVTIFALRHIT